LIDVETHRLVFVWLLEILAEHGVLRGETIGIDATTLEANAALRSIVRRDTRGGSAMARDRQQSTANWRSCTGLSSLVTRPIHHSSHVCHISEADRG
jgi:hypothetical protein